MMESVHAFFYPERSEEDEFIDFASIFSSCGRSRNWLCRILSEATSSLPRGDAQQDLGPGI